MRTIIQSIFHDFGYDPIDNESIGVNIPHITVILSLRAIDRHRAGIQRKKQCVTDEHVETRVTYGHRPVYTLGVGGKGWTRYRRGRPSIQISRVNAIRYGRILRRDRSG